jgi:hypothetical protein
MRKRAREQWIRLPRLRAVFSLDRVEPMPMPQRRRFKQTTSLHDRLAAWSEKILEQAANLPPGPEREALLKRARQADTASAWKTRPNSPGFGRIMGETATTLSSQRR